MVEQNNPPGNAAETDNNMVVFYDALTGSPAHVNFVETDDDDALYSIYPGPSAVAGDLDTVSTLTGLPAFAVDIPSASAASLGLPAGATRRGTTTSRGWVPMTLMATLEALPTTAPWVMAPSASLLTAAFAHQRPLAIRTVWLTGVMPLRGSRWTLARRLTHTVPRRLLVPRTRVR